MHCPLSKRGVAFGSLMCLVSLGVARAQSSPPISAKTSTPSAPVVGQLVSQQVAIPASASIPSAASVATPQSAAPPVASAAPVVPGFAPPQGPVIIYMPAGWEPWPGAYAANQRAAGMPYPTVAQPPMPQMAPRAPMQNSMQVAPPRATAMQKDPYLSWMQQPQPAPTRPAATQPGTFQPVFGNLGSPAKRSAPVAPPKSSVVGVFGMPAKAASQPPYVPPMSMYAPMTAQTMNPQLGQPQMHAQGVPTPAVAQQPHVAQPNMTRPQPNFTVEEDGLADTSLTPANEPPRSSRRQKYKPAPATVASTPAKTSTPARTPAQAISHPMPAVEETSAPLAKRSPAGPAKISSVVASVERPAPLTQPVPTKQPEQTQAQATASKNPAPTVAAPAKPKSSSTIVSAPRPIQPAAPRRSVRPPLAEEAIGAVDRAARRIIDPIIEPNLAEQTPICPPAHSAPATKPSRSTESPMPSPLEKPPVSLVATRPLEHARPLTPIHVAPEEKQVETVEVDEVATSEEEVSAESEDAEVCTAEERPAVIEESAETDEQLAAKELPVEGDDAAADVAIEDIPVEDVPTESVTEKAESSRQEHHEAETAKKAADDESWPELEPKSEADRTVEHAPTKEEVVAQAEEPKTAKPTPMPVAAVQPSEPQDKPVLVTDRAPAPQSLVKPKLRRDAVEASHLTAPVRSNPLRVSAKPSQASNPLR